MTITKTLDKTKKTSLEVENAICDITERNYEKYLTQDEILEELKYEKELINHDIENKNYINEAHKISLKNLIKKIDGELLVYENKKEEETKPPEVQTIIKAGGLVVGKEDRIIRNWHIKKFKNKIPYPSCSKRKVEDIYYVKDDMHSLTIGATRSRKDQVLGFRINCHNSPSWRKYDNF